MCLPRSGGRPNVATLVSPGTECGLVREKEVGPLIRAPVQMLSAELLPYCRVPVREQGLLKCHLTSHPAFPQAPSGCHGRTGETQFPLDVSSCEERISYARSYNNMVFL